MTDRTWRIVPFLNASGRQQMAIDRWFLGQHCREDAPPMLRFYTWSPVAISLGLSSARLPRLLAKANLAGLPD